MDKLFEALVETNIPTLLTISGIALLFLALAGRFGAYIEIKEERQKFTLIAGVLLLSGGIALHVMPTFLAGDDWRVARDVSDNETPEPGDRVEAVTYWIQAGAFRTPGRADAFSETLTNRLNRDPSLPELEVQVFNTTVTGCVFDRVVVIPGNPNDEEQLLNDLDRVRLIVDDALLRARDEVLNIQTECQ